MASLTRMSTYHTRLDSLLQGISTSDLPDADRDLAIRQAVREYSRDVPRREVIEFAGDGGRYYLLYGRAVDVDEAGRDAGIDLTSSGAGVQLGVLFTLAQAMDVHQVNVWLSRTGTPAGTLTLSLYTTASSLPVSLLAQSVDIDPDGDDGAPLGRYARVAFPLSTVYELPAGTYCAVLSTTGYAYENGVTEIILGVDQSSVTNSVVTYNGSAWSAYGTASAGIIEVVAARPGWREQGGAIVSIEYPAASISGNEDPQMLEPEQWQIFEAVAGDYLYFPEHAPASTENVRMTFSRPYVWTEASDPQIDAPEMHFEAISNLAAKVSCEWLATRYGQKRESTIAADSVERRTQADVYLSLANRFDKAYKRLVGLDAAQDKPGQVLTDIDYAYEVGSDFLFHRRSKR